MTDCFLTPLTFFSNFLLKKIYSKLPIIYLYIILISISYKRALFYCQSFSGKHSLKDLDVSWSSNLHDAALMRLMGSATPNTVLNSLNLAGSGVTAIGVR